MIENFYLGNEAALAASQITGIILFVGFMIFAIYLDRHNP